MDFDLPIGDDDDEDDFSKTNRARQASKEKRKKGDSSKKSEPEPVAMDAAGLGLGDEEDQFDNDLFDAPEEDEDEPVGHKVKQKVFSEKIFTEEEMEKRSFDGGKRRLLSRVIQGTLSIAFALTFMGLLYGIYGDSGDIHHEDSGQRHHGLSAVEEENGVTEVTNPITLTGLGLAFIGVVVYGYFYLVQGWKTAEDWGYIDIAL